MTALDVASHGHDHNFLGENHRRNERRVWLVIILTSLAMVIEIAAGSIYGSMALTADGWHMSTHAGAMLIAALAYFYARRCASDRRFSFGAGKFGDLGGFASAVILALVALLIGWESVVRLANPVGIDFEQALAVAALGLTVNLVCAWLLKDDHSHGHRHADGDHGQDHDGHHRHGSDNNLRAAYIHVLADALTSILAIAALLVGRGYGWVWADPLMGVVGSLVILRWSWGLIRDAGSVLLDRVEDGEELPDEIRALIESDQDRITDLHVWRVGPDHHAAIVALTSSAPKKPSFYKARLSQLHDLSHVTIEVEPAKPAAP